MSTIISNTCNLAFIQVFYVYQISEATSKNEERSVKIFLQKISTFFYYKYSISSCVRVFLNNNAAAELIELAVIMTALLIYLVQQKSYINRPLNRRLNLAILNIKLLLVINGLF